jgi:hypothetical protein
MDTQLPQLPVSFFVAIGVLVFANISTLGAFIVFIFKVGIFVAETKSGIKDAKDRANRAHARLTEHVEVHHGETL